MLDLIMYYWTALITANDYPKYSVVQQDPLPAKVKKGKSIYKINSSGFSSVKIPDLIEKHTVKRFLQKH
jgi:hypothetical protein